MTKASIAELKAAPGRYVRMAERGETVVVTSHRRPVARLVKAESEQVSHVPIITPTRDISSLNDVKPVRLRKPVDGVKVLLGDRRRR